MAEYIKRSDAMKVCQDYSSHCFTTNDASGQDIADRIENDIVEIPTADVVEVVRCEKCKYGMKSWLQPRYIEKQYLCRKDDSYQKPNHFCSYGEREEQG